MGKMGTIERIRWDIYHSEKGKFIIIRTSDWFRGIVYILANPLYYNRDCLKIFNHLVAQ